jgi:hypothetical protein
MPEGIYKFNKKFTAEQCAMDDDHGTLETETRVLTFTAPNHFKYTYHYFYQYENTSYKMVDDIRNDTVVSGTFVTDGNKIVTTIVSGEQVARVTLVLYRTMLRSAFWAAKKTSQAPLHSRRPKIDSES